MADYAFSSYIGLRITSRRVNMVELKTLFNRAVELKNDISVKMFPLSDNEGTKGLEGVLYDLWEKNKNTGPYQKEAKND